MLKKVTIIFDKTDPSDNTEGKQYYLKTALLSCNTKLLYYE